MSLLTKYTLPAERRRGCVWADEFESNQTVVRNGGTITGAPVINNGATFDGTNDYAVYNTGGIPFESNEFSIVIRFSSPLAPNDGVSHYMFDTDGSRYIVVKFASGTLAFYCAGTAIATVAYVDYGPYWVVGSENTLVFSSSSGRSNAWLNGVRILTNDATAWTSSTIGMITLAARRDTYVGKYNITYYSIRCFGREITEQEALDYCNKTTWRYREDTKFYLPMRAEQHDPVNVRTLDSSGNRNNAIFGDGSTSSTFPSKLAKRGYSFDGGDYLALPDDSPIWHISNEYSIAFVIKNVPEATDATLFGEGRSTSSVPIFRFRSRSSTGKKLVVQIRTDTSSATVNNVSSTLEPIDGRVHTIIWTDKAGDAHLYIDGQEDPTDFTHTAEALTLDRSTIGAMSLSGSIQDQMTGNVLFFSSYNKQLTPTEVADLHINMMKQIHRI